MARGRGTATGRSDRSWKMKVPPVRVKALRRVRRGNREGAFRTETETKAPARGRGSPSQAEAVLPLRHPAQKPTPRCLLTSRMITFNETCAVTSVLW